MVKSKTKRDADPYEALQRLMDEPGNVASIWSDFHFSVTEDTKERLARALIGGEEYDDRAAALIFAAILEQSLEIALTSLFVTDAERSRRLFSYDQGGPLAQFAAKITMGHALGLYGDSMRRDMARIRTIRNAFAHVRRNLEFNTPQVAKACACFDMRLYEGIKEPRTRFTAAVGSIATYLDLTTTKNDVRNNFHMSLYGELPPSLRIS